MLLASLAQANEARGAQSWGVFLPRTGALDKQVGPITSRFPAGKLAKEPAIMAHTRYATTGKVTAENAHPFRLRGGLIGAHNGVVYNHAELCKAHGDEPVDSIHLLRAIEERRPLAQIAAYGAVTYMQPRDPAVYLGRFNGGELAAARVAGGVVWSSTTSALRTALALAGLEATEYKVEEGARYVTGEGKLLLCDPRGFVDVRTGGMGASRWEDGAFGRFTLGYRGDSRHDRRSSPIRSSHTRALFDECYECRRHVRETCDACNACATCCMCTEEDTADPDSELASLLRLMGEADNASRYTRADLPWLRQLACEEGLL